MGQKKIRAKYPPDYGITYYKGKDNRNYYNSKGDQCNNRNSMRVPSLNANVRVWRNFYKLFPEVERFLVTGGGWYGTFHKTEYDEATGVYTVRKERKTGTFSVKAIKFKKIW